ncbi:MAG: type II secretion system F family protein [Gammaproteobacteria bacterium]|nr:MAG: type II secretion system F family protein [Gammaproteobacteria bacterium]
MSELLFSSAVLGTGIATFLFFAGLFLLAASVPDEDRSWMDPLPTWLKFLWPPIKVIAWYIGSNLPPDYLDRIDRQLLRTGASFLITAEQFFALRVVMAILVLLITVVLMEAAGFFEPLFILLAPIAGWFFPLVWLSDMRKRREREIIKQLPVYLDFLTMAVEAGLNLTGALQQAMDKGPKGMIRSEFGIVLRDLRSGLSRADAFKRLAERIDLPEVTGFVNSMIQAERMGSSMAATLRVQAEQRRTERFQRAEKMAMEAPVKLVFPLIAFIFPVTFIIIGFPLVMKFLNEGIL